MKRKIILFTLILSFSALLVGCWDYTELEERAIVSGAAVDKVGDHFEVTVEFISTEGSGEGFDVNPIIYTSEGITFFDAIRNLISKVGIKLYWPHAKVVVISNDIAKDDMIPILDFLNRDYEIRPDIELIISHEKTAKEILIGEDEGHGTLAFHMRDMLKAQKDLSKVPPAETWKFLHDLAYEGQSPILPLAHMIEIKEQKVPEVYGTAIFKREKMVGELGGNQTKYLLLIRDELKGGLINLKNMGEEEETVTLQIIKTKTKLKPTLDEGELIMEVDTQLDVKIAELGGLTNYIDKAGRKKVEKEAEKLVLSEIHNVISQVQDDFKTDIFMFSYNVESQLSDTWKEVKDDWTDTFSSMPVEVLVEVNLRHSNLTSKPIKVAD